MEGGDELQIGVHRLWAATNGKYCFGTEDEIPPNPAAPDALPWTAVRWTGPHGDRHIDVIHHCPPAALADRFAALRPPDGDPGAALRRFCGDVDAFWSAVVQALADPAGLSAAPQLQMALAECAGEFRPPRKGILPSPPTADPKRPPTTATAMATTPREAATHVFPAMPAVERLRAEAKAAFQRQDFSGALAAYSEAVALVEPNGDPALLAALLANRSACHLRLGAWAAAEADAGRSLR
eukprot:EG_transcript_26775